MTFNPASAVERLDESRKRRANERTLTAEEVTRLWNEVGNTAMELQLATALKFLFSTGQRVEEVVEAKWSEFDLDGGEWCIPAERRKTRAKVKHAEPHIVPLEPFHIELLKAAKKFSGRSRYVFPSEVNPEEPRTSNALYQAVRWYCRPQGDSKREPFPLFSPRDCRRTFKTLAGEAGVSKEVRDRLQGHSLTDLSSANYDRYSYMPEKREGMQIWMRYLTAIIDGAPTDNVVELRRVAHEEAAHVGR